MQSATRNPCPRCGTIPRTAAARFCTRCGLALGTGTPPSASSPIVPLRPAPPPPAAFPPPTYGSRPQPLPVPKAKSGSGCGCLIVVLLVILGLVLAFGLFSSRKARSGWDVRAEPIDAVNVPVYVPPFAPPKPLGVLPARIDSVSTPRVDGKSGEPVVRIEAEVTITSPGRSVVVAAFPAPVGSPSTLTQYGGGPFANAHGQVTTARRVVRDEVGHSGDVQTTVQLDFPASVLAGVWGPLEARVVLFDGQGNEVDRKTVPLPPVVPFKGKW